MIKILASFIDEKTLITIDDGVLSVDSKYDIAVRLTRLAYAGARKSYGPSDGFFGKYVAMQLAEYGAKIIEVSDSQEEEAKEDNIY